MLETYFQTIVSGRFVLTKYFGEKSVIDVRFDVDDANEVRIKGGFANKVKIEDGFANKVKIKGRFATKCFLRMDLSLIIVNG